MKAKSTTRRILTLISCVVLLALGCFGVWWIRSHTDGHRREYDHLELSVVWPKGWRIEHDRGDYPHLSSTSLVSNAGDAEIFIRRHGGCLTSFMDGRAPAMDAQMLKDIFDGLEPDSIELNEPTEVDGLPAHIVKLVQKTRGERLATRQLIFGDDEVDWELTCSCPVGEYETYREVFEGVENSIRLLE